MDGSRRDFLKKLGLTTLGAGVALPLLEPLRRGVLEAAGAGRGAAPGLPQGTGAGTGAAGAPSSTRQWAMVVDVEQCLRDDVRRACIEACGREHNIPRVPDPEEEIKWTWTERYEGVFPELIHAHTPAAVREAPVLVMCNHCTEPPCTKVCPTKATWKREEDGVVMMDMHRCIGCRYCMAACPFGARSFNWRAPRDYVPRDANGDFPSDYPTRTVGVVEKCTFCAERLRRGEQPACVEAVREIPGAEGALTFGDVEDPTSDASRLLRERNAVCRRESLGTGPNVYYLVPGDLPALAAAAPATHPPTARRRA